MLNVAKSAAAVAAMASGASRASGSSPQAGKAPTSAATPLAAAAASAIANKAAAAAASGDKLKPKSDNEEMKATRLGRSLASRLQRLPITFNAPPSGQQLVASTGDQVTQVSKLGKNRPIVLPRLPSVAQTDGSLSKFSSMTSPVDLLERQLRRKARELRRGQQLLNSVFEEHYTPMTTNHIPTDLARLAANTSYFSGPPQVVQAQQVPMMQDAAQVARQMAAATMQSQSVANNPLPLIANHINLLMFTAQNVTGDLVRLKPELFRPVSSRQLQPILPTVQQAAGEAQQAASTSDQESTEQKITGQQQDQVEQQADPNSVDPTKQQPLDVALADQSQEVAPSEADKQQQTDDMTRVNQRANEQQKGEVPDESQYMSFARSLPTVAPSIYSVPTEQLSSVILISGKSTTALEATTTGKPRIGVKTTHMAPFVLTTIATLPFTNGSTTPLPAPTKLPQAFKQRPALSEVWTPSVESPPSVKATSTTTKHKHVPKKKRSTDRPRSKTPKASQGGAEQLYGGSAKPSVETTKLPSKMFQQLDDRQDTNNEDTYAIEARYKADDEHGPEESPKHGVADYIRAIKLVRNLNYPWPPPTKSSVGALEDVATHESIQ